VTAVERFPVDLTRAARIYFRDSFGDPRDHGRRRHAGQDLFAPRGTPVVSPVAGRVVRVHDRDVGTCGFGVTIRDADRVLWTLCHFNAIPVVDEGASVDPGDVLGVVGTSGNAPARSPHLHIQAVTAAGIPINIFPELDAQRRAERAGVATPSPAMQASARAAARAPAGDRTIGSGAAVAAVAILAIFTFARRRSTHG